jgi:3-oxoadipate enol-lactonase
LLSLDGRSVHYEEAGSGPSVVLVHGLGGTLAIWEHVTPALAEGFRVVAYDLRGSGSSERPPGPWSLDDLVADLGRVIDAHGLAPTALVGHSMAGGIALAYAARHPENVRAVVGVGAVTELADAARDGMRQRAATVRAEGMVATAVTVATAGTAPSWREAEPEAWERFRDLLAANDPEAYALQAEVVAEIDVSGELAGIRCPVLLVAGELDAPSPPALNEANARTIKQARFVELADCGHIVPLEQPQQLLEVALPFLRDTL